jgi:glutamate N-acetyltransferase/amino-acid N-acetyltransferase
MRNLDARGWHAASRAIMTTDTVPKGLSVTFQSGGRSHVVTGIAKGAGMIRPDMATMLAFLATDVAVEPRLLRRCLVDAVAGSFNRITVDGDTSTNDACVLAATGTGAAPIDRMGAEGYRALSDAVSEVCRHLARSIVRDGEGATKLLTIHVVEGTDEDECLRVAYTVAHSPLVKTAFFASDPNWGRILAAVGRAPIPGLQVESVRIYLDEVCIVSAGARDPEYTEGRGREVMARPEVTVRIALGRGSESATVWTTDLSYDYVRINAEYRT